LLGSSESERLFGVCGFRLENRLKFEHRVAGVVVDAPLFGRGQLGRVIVHDLWFVSEERVIELKECAKQKN
jgi:hypothetical protein